MKERNAGRSGTHRRRLVLGALILLVGLQADASRAADTWQLVPGHLTTQWTKQVSPDNARPEYPRPQMTRPEWQNLNGLWDYALSDSDSTAPPATYGGQILVPFPYESSLSGVGKASPSSQRLWYHRSFTIPIAWAGQHVLLHFGAVNWDSTIAVNGQALGSHRGGYDAFSYDITGFLKPGANEITVSAWNPVRADVPDAQVLGKQRLHPGGIFYTAVTGIWQTVWLEPAPATHIDSLKITPDVDAGVVRINAHVLGAALGSSIRVDLFDDARMLGGVTGAANEDVVAPVKNPRLWSPDHPNLYNVRVTLQQNGKTADSVISYFAMRKISLGKDEQGRTRIFLNNKFLFQVGALDQGDRPDGIYTAPTDDALRYDIEMAKKLGWNLLRKHAKVEAPRWYYWTDKLGMLVWQDMPQAFGNLNDEAKTQWEIEWRREIAEFYNTPSIIVWTTFNEGWGQHDTERIVALTKQLDPTRLVNNASGWTDMKVGDIHDTHAYPGPWCEMPEATRASVDGEFGGVTMSVPGHRWNTATFGYGSVLKDARLVTKRYQDLLKKCYGLRDDRGCSAVVYTQITDVEQEINGVMTYDRAVLKPDLKITAAANRGEFLPIPANPNPDLVPTADEEPINWRYTSDRPGDDWMQTGFDDAAWRTGAAPFGHDFPGTRTQWTTSDIWIRRTFTLPDNIPAKLNFMIKHDEDADIYVNGVLAGTITGFTAEYVPLAMNDAGRATLKPGPNSLAVHVHQTIGGQGIDIGIVKAEN